MLKLNADTEEAVWKVLIYDRMGQSILAPLIKIGSLRENGITINLSLHSEREKVPDIPAIYFVSPTEDNIHRIALVFLVNEDLQKQLYDSLYLNFTSSIPRSLLQELASQSGEHAGLVSQVYDQYLNYVCLEPNLFCLELPDTYVVFNHSHSTPSLIESMVDKVVSGIFSVLVTLEVVPIIRCQSASVAEAVALKLESKLRDNIMNSRANLFPDSIHLTRPVLVLLDRNIDLASMLNHTWTYSTLVHDVLDMKLNKLQVVSSVPQNDVSTKKVQKTFDIDSSDFFWIRNAGQPFPHVIEDVGQEIDKYKLEVKPLLGSAHVESIDQIDPNNFGGTGVLSNAVKQLPELTLRKKTIDMHMTIATALLESLQSRQLDTFFKMEESISKLTKQNMLEVLADPAKQAQDKLRLFLIYYLSVDEIPKDDLPEYEAALTAAGCAIEPLQYLKHVRMSNSISSIGQQKANTSQQQSGDVYSLFTSNFSAIADKLQTSAVTGHLESLVEGVKNLLPSRKELPTTKIVDAIMEGGGPNSGVEDYIYLDPKQPKGQSKAPKGKVAFQEAVVFMIGGGNYLEYENIKQYASSSNLTKKKIVYGTTELVTAKGFVDQLSKLSPANK